MVAVWCSSACPFQYTLSRQLRARLEFLREHYQIREAEFLNFDAMRSASQCVGRVIRSKRDYGVMIFADQRYARQDKRSKIPDWIKAFIEPGNVVMSTDVAVHAARNFLLHMSQPYQEVSGLTASVWTPDDLKELMKQEAAAQAKTAVCGFSRQVDAPHPLEKAEAPHPVEKVATRHPLEKAPQKRLKLT